MRILRGHKAPHRGVAFLPDGTALVSASKDGVIKVWDLPSGELRTELLLSPPNWCGVPALGCLAVSSSSQTIAAGGYTVGLWDVASGQAICVDAPERINIECLAFTPDGKHLVAGTFWPVEGIGVWAWDAITGERAFSRCQVPGGVWGMALAPAGETVASASPEGNLTLWHLATGEHLWEWKYPGQGFAHALAFSPDGRLLALASMQLVWLFDVQGQKLLTRWQTHEKHHLNALCFSPDGRLLATGANDRTVTFWAIDDFTDKPPRKCAGFDWGLGKVRSVAFAPDGMTAAAAGDNRKVVIWDIADE